jgi:hypothetical protein
LIKRYEKISRKAELPGKQKNFPGIKFSGTGNSNVAQYFAIKSDKFLTRKQFSFMIHFKSDNKTEISFL